MLSSLFRTQRRQCDQEGRSPYASNQSPLLAPRPASDDPRDDFEEEHGNYGNDEDYESGDDGEDEEINPLLPIFSADYLDKLPIYNLTHSIRLLVIQRCETTLSWDQLRSPQISQFLVKPVQQQIQNSYFNRATIFVLIANCLQFHKEGESNPGIVGVSKTRALLCELLATRLLKEFTTRELIDALSYDFDPLQGLVAQTPPTPTPGSARPKPLPKTARLSTVEIAIRAHAKKFIAHPLVVQQLEAIWAGTIVFHSSADHAHRTPATQKELIRRTYGSLNHHHSKARVQTNSRKGSEDQQSPQTVRRTVTLYDPRDASLFKLSRLRVPRYRSFFSTVSYSIMLLLFLSVLIEKSVDITALELLFWFWSAGYMLDEVVGFSEQGFSLYIMSVWNAFDLGILLLFFLYYVLRLYGILMPDTHKRRMADMAYDVLASTAVLLLPRLFSVLDHYRYFSQLLIAFRMMALDLAAILILIVISCSGFFVAFTLSFSDSDFTAASAAYALFQILMGYTPAAWEVWGSYNILGKAILTLFLIICHFLIVTILITVLTNSFMAVVQNANEEHQFLFAVNTISMVKSDALFSYIPPSNIIGWFFSPLRYCLPFRQFLKLNRTIIKLTHVPLLFSIFAYERLIMSREAYDPTDLVEQRGRTMGRLPAFSMRAPHDLFSPGHRLREPSVATFRKDRRLEEVFRRPFRDPTGPLTHEQAEQEQRKSTTVVQNWMKGMQHEDEHASPMEQPRSVLERLEKKRPTIGRSKTAHAVLGSDFATTLRPAASDPDDSTRRSLVLPRAIKEETDEDLAMTNTEDLPRTDAEDAYELSTSQDNSFGVFDGANKSISRKTSDKGNTPSLPQDSEDDDGDEQDYFQTPRAARSFQTPVTHFSSSLPFANRPHLQNQIGTSPLSNSRPPSRRAAGPPLKSYNRNISTNTIFCSPHAVSTASASPSKRPPTAINSAGGPSTGSGTATPRRIAARTRPRPIMPSRILQSAPNINLANFLALDRTRRKPSMNALALDLASDLGDNRVLPDTHFSGIPGSFTTQLQMWGEQHRSRWNSSDEEDAERRDEGKRMSRIMLARMNTLEEGFREVLKEVKVLTRGGSVEDGEEGVWLKERRSAGGERRRRKGKDRAVVGSLQSPGMDMRERRDRPRTGSSL